MTQRSFCLLQLRLARVFAEEAVRMNLAPLPCWSERSTEERRAHARRCLAHWARVQQKVAEALGLEAV